MKIKLLFYSAIVFLVLGLKTKDGPLFIFFAIHLFMLTIGLFFFKLENRKPAGNKDKAPAVTDPRAS